LSKNVLWLAQAVFSYFVLDSSKIPLVLTTQVTHLRSLMQFRQPDRVNSVVRTVYLAITANLVPSGDSGMKKVGGPLRGQGKIRGGNKNIYLAWRFFIVLKIKLL